MKQYHQEASATQHAFIKPDTGVCKINGVVVVANYCCSIGFSAINNNKNTVYFASTGNYGNDNSSYKNANRDNNDKHGNHTDNNNNNDDNNNNNNNNGNNKSDREDDNHNNDKQ